MAVIYTKLLNTKESKSLVFVNATFSALTLLVGHEEEHPACKYSVVRCWCGYLSGARCRLFAYGLADATAIPKPHHLLPHLNPDCFSVFAFLIPAYSGCPGKKVDGCSSSGSSSNSSSSFVYIFPIFIICDLCL